MATGIAAEGHLASHDETQVALMKETIVVVSPDDEVLGFDSKENCHLMTNINKGLLHRAFSVFLFNEKNELLLQQRAECKITFPRMWTNTCCSHMLHTPAELDTQDDLGAKRAGQRKLLQELGIPADQLPLSQFHFLTRIHYKAASDGVWGEHEIDYILFIRVPVTLALNPNEVMDVKYVTQAELRALIEDAGRPDATVQLTPWFSLIAKTHLFGWWDALIAGEPLPADRTIHRML